MFKIYVGEMLARSCNNSMKCHFHKCGAHSARPVFNFPDIRCVVTLYNFPRISRQSEKPLPNIIMKILSFPYTFKEGVSNVSNCLSLLAYFSIS